MEGLRTIYVFCRIRPTAIVCTFVAAAFLGGSKDFLLTESRLAWKSQVNLALLAFARSITTLFVSYVIYSNYKRSPHMLRNSYDYSDMLIDFIAFTGSLITPLILLKNVLIFVLFSCPLVIIFHIIFRLIKWIQECNIFSNQMRNDYGNLFIQNHPIHPSTPNLCGRTRSGTIFALDDEDATGRFPNQTPIGTPRDEGLAPQHGRSWASTPKRIPSTRQNPNINTTPKSRSNSPRARSSTKSRKSPKPSTSAKNDTAKKGKNTTPKTRTKTKK